MLLKVSNWFNEESNKCLKLSFSSRSGTCLKQSSIEAFLPQPLSKAVLQKIEDNIAMHYNISGSSFIQVEERHLLEAFKIARPDVVVPDRRKLAGAALDRCYASVKKLADRDPTMIDCLTTDAASNVNNDSVVNCMSISRSHALFLESVTTGEESHMSELMAADLPRVIEDLHSRGVAIRGSVTENTGANKKTW
jgi:hypothetical protein